MLKILIFFHRLTFTQELTNIDQLNKYFLIFHYLTNINWVEDKILWTIEHKQLHFCMPTFWIHEPHPLEVSLLPTCFFIESHLTKFFLSFFSIISINMALKKNPNPTSFKMGYGHGTFKGYTS